MKTARFLSLMIIIILVSFLASCEYDFVKPELVPPPPDPTDTIYFAQEVQPIFDANNCTGCHKPNGAAGLDLTAPNAYNSIISNGLVDATDPPSSRIYYFPYPGTGEHSYKYSTEAEASQILYWIEQGALNN